jgi:pilus assembly protein Flp/PilA
MIPKDQPGSMGTVGTRLPVREPVLQGGPLIMLAAFKQFLRDQSGATAIEYGLIAALVSVAAIAALSAMGGSLDTMFTSVADTLSCAVGTTTSGGAACPGAAP